MVSNMKKTLAGLALAALPLMASAQINEMNDQSLAEVKGQSLGLPVPFVPVFLPIGLPFSSSVSLIGLPFSQGPSLIDIEWSNFGLTSTPLHPLSISVFNTIPGIGPHLILGLEPIFKIGVLGGVVGGVGAAVGTTYLLQNGLTLPIPNISFTPTKVL